MPCDPAWPISIKNDLLTFARKWSDQTRCSLQTVNLRFSMTNKLMSHEDKIKIHINVKYGNLITRRFHKRSLATTSCVNILVDIPMQYILGRDSDGSAKA